MQFRSLIIVIIFIGLSYSSLYAQGIPYLEVYTPDDYGDFRQKWDIAQHDMGYLLFGNSNGLVRFDGSEWHSERVEAGRIVRTLAKTGGVIHWGGSGNFGIMDSDSLGALKPVSYRNKVDTDEVSIGDIWESVEHQGAIYHRTFEALYKVHGDSVSVISGDTYFNVLSLFDQLVINRRNHPLAFYKNGQYRDIPGSEIYERETIYVALPFKEGYLLGSRDLGLIYFDGNSFIPFQTDVDDYLEENLIYKAVWIHENELALGTLRGGIVVINGDGEHQYTLTEDEGLPTNIIYDLFVDSEETLWASTDNGIVKIFAKHPVKVLNEYTGLSGASNFVQPYQERVYIGTTDGLFATNENGKVRRVGDRPAYFFDSIIIDDVFYSASNDGLFLVNGFEKKQMHSNRTEELAAHPTRSNTLFAVNRGNLYRYSIEEESVQVDTLLSMDSRIRSIQVDDRFIWLAVDDLTVHRLDVADISNRQTFNVALPGNSRLNELQFINGKLILSADDGIFYFNSNSNSFEPDSTYGDPELNRYQVSRFKECQNGDIWFRNRGKIKRAALQSGRWQVFENSFRTIGRNQAITSINCDADGSVWISSSGDVYHVQEPGWEFSPEFHTNITFAATENDTLYRGTGEMSLPVINYDNNNLRFRYAAASFVSPGETEYRVRLSGYDEDWSDWTSETQKDYTFIREGTYSFDVESRNIFQLSGSNSSFTFTILPPWYRTIWAYIGYFLLTVGLIYGGHRVRVNSILREQRIRDGIARDLHDELSSTMSSINFFADAIGSEKLKPENKERFLSLIQKSSNEAKEKISDIVWVIHSENDGWDNLIMRCKRYSADLLDSRGISYTFEVKDQFSGKPTITQRKNIWLIFREIITNIGRHSHASQVDLLIKKDSEQFCMEIADNGVGFHPGQKRSDGNGILNIRERVKQLQGECILETKPERGTRWNIKIPFRGSSSFKNKKQK